MPTRFTRTSGALPVISAGLWLVSAAMELLAVWTERVVGRWEGVAEGIFTSRRSR